MNRVNVVFLTELKAGGVHPVNFDKLAVEDEPHICIEVPVAAQRGYVLPAKDSVSRTCTTGENAGLRPTTAATAAVLAPSCENGIYH